MSRENAKIKTKIRPKVTQVWILGCLCLLKCVRREVTANLQSGGHAKVTADDSLAVGGDVVGRTNLTKLS